MNRWNRNKKGQRHGYCKLKYTNGKVVCKCTLNNEIWIGYGEAYDINSNGKIGYKEINI